MFAQGSLSGNKGGRLDLKAARCETADDFILENVCGVSCASKDVMAANPVNGNIAFAASSFLVFFDPRYSKQEFLENPTGRTIRAVTFSDDGKHVAFGEVGYNPHVFIYTASERRQVSKFQVPDMCSVKAIEFHPRSIYLAILYASSYNIFLFDLRGKKVAVATFVVEPLGMTLPKVGSYLVVCGHRKLSLFSLVDINTNTFQTNIVFDRRSVLLGHQSDYTFVDVASGTGLHKRKIYTVTSCGYLCDIGVGDILIDRAAKIDERCFCVKYSLACLFVGCARSTIKICSPGNLSIVSTISNRERFASHHSQPSIWNFEANTIAVAVNSTTKIISCVFGDHCRHSWRVSLNNDSIQCHAVIPVDADGNEVAWQPTSYEIQAKVANVLNQDNRQKNKMNSKDAAERIGGFSDRCNFKQPTAPVYVNATRFTPDGKKIICGNAEGEIKIFDAASGRLFQVIEAHSSAVTHIELLFDDHFGLVASGGRDRVIFILDAHKKYSLVQVICDHSSAIVSISMAHHSGTLTLVSSASDGVILIRRAIKGKQLRFVIVGELSELGGKSRIYAYGTDFIFTTGDNGQINVFQTDPFISTRPTKTIKSSSKGKRYMKIVAIDPSGCYLVTNSTNGTMVFNTHTGKHVTTLTKMLEVSLITFTNDLKYLVSESNDGCRFVWRLPSRMSDIMRAKVGEISAVQRDIPYDRILSCVSLNPKGQSPLEDDTVKDLSSEEVENTAVHMSKLYFQDEDKSMATLESSHSDCESYSSCTTCSRSYTDVLDYSLKRHDVQGSGHYETEMNCLSNEAKRLLRDSFEPRIVSTNVTVDKTATRVTSSYSFTTEGKLLTCSLSSEEKAVLPPASNIATPEGGGTLKRSSPGERRKIGEKVEIALANFHKNSCCNKGAVCSDESPAGSSPKKKMDSLMPSVPSHNPDALLESFGGADVVSTGSEYLSAGSHESVYPDESFDGRVQQQHTLSADSKTIQPSEFVSEMHDYFKTAPIFTAATTEGSLHGIACTDPDSCSDRSDQKTETETLICAHERYCVSTTESHDEFKTCEGTVVKETHNCGTLDDQKQSPTATNRSTETINPIGGAVDETENGVGLQTSEQPDKKESASLLCDQGERKAKDQALKECVHHMGDADVDGAGKTDFQPCQGDGPRDTNQNTGPPSESESSLMASDRNFVGKSWHVHYVVCLNRVNKTNYGRAGRERLLGDKNEKAAGRGIATRVFVPRVTQLSNSQETFFDFVSELRDYDVMQDLAQISISDDGSRWGRQPFVKKIPSLKEFAIINQEDCDALYNQLSTACEDIAGDAEEINATPMNTQHSEVNLYKSGHENVENESGTTREVERASTTDSQPPQTVGTGNCVEAHISKSDEDKCQSEMIGKIRESISKFSPASFSQDSDVPVTIPFPGRQGSKSPQIIEGLGSVENLYRNQDDYLRKLREVRLSFELSIQALRDGREKTQLGSRQHMKED